MQCLGAAPIPAVASTQRSSGGQFPTPHEAPDGQDKAALPGSSCTPGVTRYILHSLNSKNVQVVLSMPLLMLKQNQAAVRQFYCRQS